MGNQTIWDIQYFIYTGSAWLLKTVALNAIFFLAFVAPILHAWDDLQNFLSQQGDHPDRESQNHFYIPQGRTP